jgi:integrase
MARFLKRNSGWYVQFRRKGHDQIARTFDTKAEAERWALSIESKMGTGAYVDDREVLNISLLDCLERYRSTVTIKKKGADRETYRINLWKSDKLSSKPIGLIKQSDIAQWRDTRISSGVGGNTVKKDMALLSNVFTIAISEWNYPLTNPVLAVGKPKINPGRDRRLYAGEEELLLSNCNQEMQSFIILAIETAMRRSEIVALKRNWIKGNVAYLPDTKNSTARQVPLSNRALKAIEEMPVKENDSIFSFLPSTYSKSFLRICRKVGIEGLTEHDLRHEACSRLFEKGLDLMQVKAVSGHKSTQMLARYTHLNANDIAKLLN